MEAKFYTTPFLKKSSFQITVAVAAAANAFPTGASFLMKFKCKS